MNSRLHKCSSRCNKGRLRKNKKQRCGSRSRQWWARYCLRKLMSDSETFVLSSQRKRSDWRTSSSRMLKEEFSMARLASLRWSTYLSRFNKLMVNLVPAVQSKDVNMHLTMTKTLTLTTWTFEPILRKHKDRFWPLVEENSRIFNRTLYTIS